MKIKNIFPALLIVFIDSFSFTVMIPILPFIVEQYHQGDIAYGILLSAYAMSQFIAAPYLGTLSDKYGRKPVLIISQLGTLISWGIFAAAWFVADINVLGISLPILIIFLSRIIDGITGGNYSVAMAYISDVTPAKDRSYTFGMVNAMAGIAILVGPAFGSFTFSTKIGYLGTIIGAGSISLIALLFMLRINETLPVELRNNKKIWVSWKELLLWKRIIKFRTASTILKLLNIKFYFSFVVNAFTAVIILFAIDVFAFSEKELGITLVLAGIAMVLNQLLLVRFFVSKYGDQHSMITGIILMASGMAFSVLSTNIYYLLFTFFIMSIGISIGMATIASLLTKIASVKQQGEILGLDTAINAFTAGIAPVTASIIYTVIGKYVFVFLGAIVLMGPILNRFSNRNILQKQVV